MSEFQGEQMVAEAFERHVGPVRDALSAWVSAESAKAEGWGWLPSSHSLGMRQIADQHAFAAGSPWGKDPVEQALGLSHLLVVGAEDGVRSICRLLTGEPTPTYAHLTLARGVLEHAGRAWWLLDPKASTAKRICRGMNERISSLAEQQKLPIRDADRARSRDWLRGLHVEADGLGLQVLKGKRSPGWLLEERPSATALVRAILKDDKDGPLGRVQYGYLSAVIHGTSFGLAQSIDADASGGSTTPGVSYGAVYTSSLGVCTVLTSLVLALGELYERRDALLGWTETTEARRQAFSAATASLAGRLTSEAAT